MMNSITSRFHASIFKKESQFSLNKLARMNTIIDLIRRSYNRLTQWFNLLGMSIGSLNRTIPYVGLIFNLINLALRAFIGGMREKTSSISKFIYIALISCLALSSLFIVINTGAMSIVWLSLTSAFTRVILDGADILFNLPLFQKAQNRLHWQEITQNLQQQKRQNLEQERSQILCKIILLCKIQENNDFSQNVLIPTLSFYENTLNKLNHKIACLDEIEKAHENSLRNIGLNATRFIGGLIIAMLSATLLTLAITSPMLAFNLIIAIEIIECLVLAILFQQYFNQTAKEEEQALIENESLNIDNAQVMNSYTKIQEILEQNEINLELECSQTMIALIDSTVKIENTSEKEINKYCSTSDLNYFNP